MDYYHLIAQVIDAFDDGSTFPSSVAEISRSYHLSYFHFSRIFQAVTHQTLKSYVDERRLNNAARQLRGTRKKVIDIALNCGFQSHEAFSRRFHQAFGLSPSQYRRALTPPPLLPKAKVVARSLKQIGSSIAADYQLVEQPRLALEGWLYDFDPDEAGSFDRLTQNTQSFVEQHISPYNIQRLYSVITRPPDPGEQAAPGFPDHLACFLGRETRANLPSGGLSHFSLLQARYAVFRYQGDLCAIFETVFSDVCLTLMAAGLALRKSELEFITLYEGNYFQDGWFKIFVPVM